MEEEEDDDDDKGFLPEEEEEEEEDRSKNLRPKEIMRGKRKMRKRERMKANSDMSQPLSAWSKSKAAVAYIWMRRGA